MRQLHHNYCRSSYFYEVAQLIDGVFDEKETRLSLLAKSSIRAVLEYLDWKTPVEYDTSRFDPLEEKLEAYLLGEWYQKPLNLKKKRMMARVEALCNDVGADIYINPIGGTALYDKEEFASAGIQLNFLFSRISPYSQKSSDFIPNLSIIDVLMNNSKEKTREMLSAYTLE